MLLSGILEKSVNEAVITGELTPTIQELLWV